jgi:mRNA interferase MazF
VVVVALTSNPESTDYSFTIISLDLVQGTLKRSSQVRVDKLYTLSQSIIVKTFGRVNESVIKRIETYLQTLTQRKEKV